MLKKEIAWVWLPTILYAIVIFTMSSTPGKYLPELFPGADKLIHLVEYLPFGFLVLRAISRSSNSVLPPRALLISIFVIMLYALSDETHQLFVPGRQFDLIDMLFDTVGGAIGSIAYRWLK